MIRGLLLMLAVGSGASVAAAEPVALIDAQLDRVTAGALAVVNEEEVFLLMPRHERNVDFEVIYEVIEDASGFVRVAVLINGGGEQVSTDVSEPSGTESR